MAVPTDVLDGLNELRILKLNGNTIAKIETGAFRDMPSLKVLEVTLKLVQLTLLTKIKR